MRFELYNYREQIYGDTAVCSYTLVLSPSIAGTVSLRSHNETRVIVKMADGWRVVHVHNSPAWNAPFRPPR